MTNHMIMKNLPESERPYEKFQKMGVESLTDAELVAVIIKTGTCSKTAMDIARELLLGKQNNLLNLFDYS